MKDFKAGVHSILSYGVILTLSYGPSGLTILNDDILSRLHECSRCSKQCQIASHISLQFNKLICFCYFKPNNLSDKFFILESDKILENIYMERKNMSAGRGLRTSNLQVTRHPTASEPASVGRPV
jgi:hypothetical protein